MKKTSITIALILLSAQSFAAVEMVWQQDLSPHLGSITNWGGSDTDISNMRQFANDNVGLLFGYGGNNNALLVVDASGDILINDVFYAAGEPVRFVGRASIEQFVLETDVLPGPLTRTLRIYEYDGTNLTVTNLPTDGFSLPEYEGTVSSVFYTLTGTTLSKYQFDSDPVNILGEVYAGIDGSNFKLTWNSVSGSQYQIQSASNLTNWVDVGSTIVGTGAPLSWANALTNTSSFFRVIEQ